MSLKDKYAIVGVGYAPQGVIPNRTALSFHVEACANAIKDAGLKKEPNTLRRDKLRELLKNYINYPYHALEQAMVNEIVDPRDTRPVLIRTLKNLANKEVAPRPWRKHSLVPQ